MSERDRLIEEARSIAPMSEERDYIEGLCAALEDAEQEMKALRMALEISGERRETCERDRERLRWFYDNMRMADRLNLQMVYEHEHPGEGRP